MNILYIEDDPNDAELVALYARARQHNLVVVTRSDEFQGAVTSDPDLILIDLLLGQAREGYSIARCLREQGNTRPIIAVTALATSHDQAECRSAGFTELLIKPYTIHQLADVITRYTK